MNEYLLEALEVLIATLEAGSGFDHALYKYSQAADNELSRAFGKVLEEIRTGTGRRAAVRNMAAQVDHPQVTSFVEAVVRADQEGTSVLEVLREQRAQLARG